MKRIGLRAVFAGVLFTAALGLNGCSGNFKSTEAQNMMVQETAAMAEAGYGLETSSRNLDTAAMEAPVAGGSEIAMEGSSVPQGTLKTGRKLIQNIRLDLESTDFDNLITGISEKVTQLGGYVESSNISGSSITGSNRYRNAYITARIPSDQLDAFVTAVSEQGNVTNTSKNTTDVTLQYTDIESRKKSLLKEQERLWELLEKAESLEGVIAIETRLSEIQYQLESYESQLRLYDNQVDYSTVELSVNEVKVFTPTTPDSVITRIQKGFLQNLNYLADFLVNLFIFLAAYSPIIIILIVIVLVIWIFIKRAVRKQKHVSSVSSINHPDPKQEPENTKETKQELNQNSSNQ